MSGVFLNFEWDALSQQLREVRCDGPVDHG